MLPVDVAAVAASAAAHPTGDRDRDLIPDVSGAATVNNTTECKQSTCMVVTDVSNAAECEAIKVPIESETNRPIPAAATAEDSAMREEHDDIHQPGESCTVVTWIPSSAASIVYALGSASDPLSESAAAAASGGMHPVPVTIPVTAAATAEEKHEKDQPHQPMETNDTPTMLESVSSSSLAPHLGIRVQSLRCSTIASAKATNSISAWREGQKKKNTHARGRRTPNQTRVSEGQEAWIGSSDEVGSDRGEPQPQTTPAIRIRQHQPTINNIPVNTNDRWSKAAHCFKSGTV